MKSIRYYHGFGPIDPESARQFAAGIGDHHLFTTRRLAACVLHLLDEIDARGSGVAARRQVPGAEPQVIYATVREAVHPEDPNDTILHIECRFDDGQKFAPVTVDSDCDELAHLISAFLNYGTVLTLHDGPVTPLDHPVKVEARDGIGPNNTSVRRWAVTRNGDVWSKAAEGFVYEPLPSDRDDQFVADTRFAAIAEALRVARAIRSESR